MLGVGAGCARVRQRVLHWPSRRHNWRRLRPRIPACKWVLQVSTILLDGRPVTASQPLSEGTILEVLPQIAGG